MKIVIISDTHGRHEDIILPKGDLLIHAGDVSNHGTKNQIEAFLKWFSEQDFNYKIFIAGNHDFLFENETPESIEALIPDDVTYLNDSEITIEGIKIWGSPIQPEFMDWAFNRKRGAEIKTHWDLIPNETDILITHGPPYGILDKNMRGMSCGCEELKKAVDRTQPKLHIFGHIHEGHGIEQIDNTTFINASQLNYRYSLTNEPLAIDLNI